jgi:hypothetical protein
MEKIMILIFCLMLFGCAPIKWRNSDLNVGQQQFSRDFRECNYEAKKATPQWNGAGDAFAAGIMSGLNERNLAIMCMELRGYIRE